MFFRHLKYNISILSHSNDFVHQFSKWGLIFSTCECNSVYSQNKNLVLLQIIMNNLYDSSDLVKLNQDSEREYRAFHPLLGLEQPPPNLSCHVTASVCPIFFLGSHDCIACAFSWKKVW